MANYKLTYLDGRGRAEPLRLIFTVAGQPFEDKRISYADLAALKSSLPWGQVPILQVGDKTIAQTATIARFLARRFNLAGADEFAVTKCEELNDALYDLQYEWAQVRFVEQDETKKAEMKKVLAEQTLPKYMEKFDKIQAENGGNFLVGPTLTWADVFTANMLETLDEMFPNFLDNYPNLKKMKTAFFAIPSVKAYVEKRPPSQF